MHPPSIILTKVSGNIKDLISYTCSVPSDLTRFPDVASTAVALLHRVNLVYDKSFPSFSLLPALSDPVLSQAPFYFFFSVRTSLNFWREGSMLLESQTRKGEIFTGIDLKSAFLSALQPDIFCLLLISSSMCLFLLTRNFARTENNLKREETIRRETGVGLFGFERCIIFIRFPFLFSLFLAVGGDSEEECQRVVDATHNKSRSTKWRFLLSFNAKQST